MTRNFYKYDESVDILDTPLIPDLILKTNLKELTLPTGNQVIESIPLTQWFHNTRGKVISQLSLWKYELETQKSAVRNEFNTVQTYLRNNIFQDPYEFHQIPQTNLLILCAYFAGRIASNKSNWGRAGSTFFTPAVTSSLTSRIFTSVPSKVFLPWVLAGYVFHEMMPNSFHNAVRCAERDAIPSDISSQYHSMWNTYYVNGVKKTTCNLFDSIEFSLRDYFRCLRETIGSNSR